MRKMLLIVLASVLALMMVAGCSSDEADVSEEASAEETVDTEATAEDEGEESAEATGEGESEFSGSWENPDGSVFRELTFYDDGTADAVNYAGAQTSATWTYEDDYLKVESDAGETWGSSVEWISDTEFKWSYESDTWTKVE